LCNSGPTRPAATSHTTKRPVESQTLASCGCPEMSMITSPRVAREVHIVVIILGDVQGQERESSQFQLVIEVGDPQLTLAGMG
jgi:hypothetical protein